MRPLWPLHAAASRTHFIGLAELRKPRADDVVRRRLCRFIQCVRDRDPGSRVFRMHPSIEACWIGLSRLASSRLRVPTQPRGSSVAAAMLNTLAALEVSGVESGWRGPARAMAGRERAGIPTCADLH